MNRYDFYPGDYLKDTIELSMLEDGAYRRLMDHYYATEQPIPDKTRYRIARATTRAEKRAVDTILDRFWTLSGSQWVHEKIEKNIELAMRKVATSRGNGRKGGRPRKQGLSQPPENPPGYSEETQNGTQEKTQTEPVEKANPKPTQKLPSPSPSDPKGSPPLPPRGGGGGGASLEGALNLPLDERLARYRQDPLWADWVEPEKWPEVQQMAGVFAAGFGFAAPKLSDPRRDAATRRILELLEAFDHDDLLRAEELIPKSKYLKNRRSISALTIEVMRNMLNQRESVEDSDDESTMSVEDIVAKRRRDAKAKELGLL